MDDEQLIQQARILITNVQESPNSFETLQGVVAATREFFRQYAGEKSSFYISIKNIDSSLSSNRFRPGSIKSFISSHLDQFIGYVEHGLFSKISIERKAQLDVVSDFIEQAQLLLDQKDVHPATPAMIIGASLEEFLRNWVEGANLDIGSKRRSINTYAETLRSNELITKQDVKDITSWAGIRNHATHGDWEEVSDKHRISLMLEGVNLFMRNYGSD